MDRRHKPLNTLDAVVLTIGTMVGAGIFSILALTVRTAGPAAVLAWLFIVVLSLPMAYVFSDLTGVLQESGGPYLYLKERIHSVVGQLVAWSFLLSSFGASAALLMMLQGMLRQLHVPAPIVVTFVLLMTISWIIARGIHIGAVVQRALTTTTVTILLLCIVIGLTHARWLPDYPIPTFDGKIAWRTLYSNIFTHGWMAVFPAAFYAFWTYSGWEAVMVPSSAYKSRKSLARGMNIGSLIVGVLYVLVALAAVLSVPTNQLMNHMNPLQLVGRIWGPFVSDIVGFGAVVTVIGSLLSWMIASTGLVQAVIRERIVPAPKWLVQAQGEYHPFLAYFVAVLLFIAMSLPILTPAIAASSMTALLSYAVIFLAVTLDKQAHWSGVIASPSRRRGLALIAFFVSLVIIIFSGWSNVWPTLILQGMGLVGILAARLRSTRVR